MQVKQKHNATLMDLDNPNIQAGPASIPNPQIQF